MSSYPAADHYRAPKERGGFAGAIVLLLGLAVGVLVIGWSSSPARPTRPATTRYGGRTGRHSRDP